MLSEKEKAQRTETDVAVQSSEGSLCFLNYLYYGRHGMLWVGVIQILALLSSETQTVTKSKIQKSSGRNGFEKTPHSLLLAFSSFAL